MHLNNKKAFFLSAFIFHATLFQKSCRLEEVLYGIVVVSTIPHAFYAIHPKCYKFETENFRLIAKKPQYFHMPYLTSLLVQTSTQLLTVNHADC